jgi:hypothetical protein
VDGRNTLHVIWHANGLTHFEGFDSRTRAAIELLEQHQMELAHTPAIESLEAVKTAIDNMIRHRRMWYAQEQCLHEWVETSEGRQCIRPECQLFEKKSN